MSSLRDSRDLNGRWCRHCLVSVYSLDMRDVWDIWPHHPGSELRFSESHQQFCHRDRGLGFRIYVSFQFHSLLPCKAARILQGKKQHTPTPSSGWWIIVVKEWEGFSDNHTNHHWTTEWRLQDESTSINLERKRCMVHIYAFGLTSANCLSRNYGHVVICEQSPGLTLP